MGYIVMVNDNFHYMNESERYLLGEFAEVEVGIGHAGFSDGEIADYLAKQRQGASNVGARPAYVRPVKNPNVDPWPTSSDYCVFRRSVTDDFGNVTGNSGDVTEGVSSHI